MKSSKRVLVKGVQGRIAYTAYRDGKIIPVNKETLVEKTAWIDKRLADGDIVLVKHTATKSSVKQTGEDN